MPAYIYQVLFRAGWEGAGGLFEMFSTSCSNELLVAANILLLCLENVWKDFKKSNIVLNGYSHEVSISFAWQKYRGVTSNQPSIPCFNPHKTSSNHRLLLNVAPVFSTFAWLWTFLTEIVLICRSLFRYCGARGKIFTLKNIFLWANLPFSQSYRHVRVQMGNTLHQYRQAVGMYFIYLVVKEFRGCFKGKFWCSVMLLFHLKKPFICQCINFGTHIWNMANESLVAYTDVFAAGSFLI